MGKDILLVAEHFNGKVKKYSFELASVAKQIADKTGGQVHAVLIGQGVTAGAAELGKFGVAKVHVVDGPDGANYNAEVWTNAVAAAVKAVSPAVVLGTASPAGRDTLPRVAARLGTGYANDCVDVKYEGKLTAKRPLYSGKVYTQVTFSGELALLTCRPNTFPVPAAGTASAEVMPLAGSFSATKYTVKEVLKGDSDKPDLTEAEIIISGGRAMKEANNFKILWSSPSRSARRRPSARRAPPSTPATRPTRCRSDRRARPSARSSTWRWESPARSSTSRACAPRR